MYVGLVIVGPLLILLVSEPCFCLHEREQKYRSSTTTISAMTIIITEPATDDTIATLLICLLLLAVGVKGSFGGREGVIFTDNVRKSMDELVSV